MDAFTWCEYLAPILHIYLDLYKREQLSKEGIVVNSNRRGNHLITYSLIHSFTYLLTPFS
jgi:hypothetical protein